MLKRFRIGRQVRMLAILAGLLTAGALAVPLLGAPAHAQVATIEQPVECGIVEELGASGLRTVAADEKPPPRCEIRTKDYSYVAKIVDGKLVVTFGDGKVCKLSSVKAVTGTLDRDGVTMTAPLNNRGGGMIKADITFQCGDNKYALDGFRVSYDAQINEYDVDEGTFRPIVEA